MPLLWRYLLGSYLKTFTLCVASFVAILLTMRMDEIAYIATLGPEGRDILWFTLQQIPYLIPIAMPISALIASVILMQTLSKGQEITSLRACGFSLKNILAPVLIAGIILAVLNFFFISELASNAHLSAGNLKNKLRSINPLFLLNNKQAMHAKGFYFDTFGQSKLGEYAQDIIFLSPSHQSDRLNLLVAKKIKATPEIFTGHSITLVTGQKKGDSAESLVLENVQHSTTTIEDFTQMIEKKIWSINNDHLSLPLLLVRIDDAKEALKAARETGTPAEIKQASHHLNRAFSEIIKRFSVAVAVFTFTLMGLAFGINIGRSQSNRGILAVALMASLFIICFFGAKSFDYALISASILYLAPHVIIILASFWKLHKISIGAE